MMTRKGPRMNRSLSLDGKWLIKRCDDLHGRPEFAVKCEVDEGMFNEAEVPGEVHLDLMRIGQLDDVCLATNAQSARWVEEYIWVYRKEIDVPAAAVDARATWLVFEGLDLNAVVYINGEEAGTHANAHIPCRIDVTGKLKTGRNVLAVKLDGGLFGVADKPGYCYEPWSINFALHKRSWSRKPQYQFSWDWNPRLINVGIWKPVRLEWCDDVRMDQVSVFSELSEDHSLGTIHCRFSTDNVGDSDLEAAARITCMETGVVVEESIVAAPGDSRHELILEVTNPELWWPVPHGDQPLYTVVVELLVDGKVIGKEERRVGMRRVTINQDRHPVEGRYFIIEINGRSIFMKGGNWVPPDLIYARIDGERCRKLIDLALECNCNAMRVWGGGLYADHAMMDACDEKGVLVWHDFLYACAKYPLDDVDFMHNIEAEAIHGIRDLAHHASLVLWCGNNEVDEAFYGWEGQTTKPYPHYAIFHHILPILMKREDPSRPYWPGSPYSPDHDPPSSPICGDQHPWDVSVRDERDNIWHYRSDVSRCANEGGVLGASSPATIKQFLPDDQRNILSPSWIFHDNAVNFFCLPSLCDRMVENWVGRPPREMPFEDYIFYSALMQAEGQKEYIDNYRRRMYSSSAAIFWMYNDSWPTSHGWTIVDYYLRRKLSFHPVRRAFEPLTVIPAVEDDHVLIMGVNERPMDWTGNVRYGIAKTLGGMAIDETVDAAIPPNSSVELARIPMSDWSAAGTTESLAFALLLEEDKVVAQNRILVEKFKDLAWGDQDVTVERDGDDVVFSSASYVWGVCLDLDGDDPLPDNAFDLLPGIRYRIPWPRDRQVPAIIRTGNLR